MCTIKEYNLSAHTLPHNATKIHSIDLCLEFDLDPTGNIGNACLNGKFSEYIGPENDNWINDLPPTILGTAALLKMRHAAFSHKTPYINLTDSGLQREHESNEEIIMNIKIGGYFKLQKKRTMKHLKRN